MTKTRIPTLKHVSLYAALSFGAALSASAAGADDLAASLVPGTRVRIVAPDVAAGKLIGTVSQVSDDSLTLAVPGHSEPVSVMRAKIEQLDVSEGPRPRAVDAAIGALIGAGVGAAAGALGSSGGHNHVVSGGEVAALGAVAGAVLGAFIGVEIPPGERWKPASATRYRVSFAPRLDHGLDVAFAWNF